MNSRTFFWSGQTDGMWRFLWGVEPVIWYWRQAWTVKMQLRLVSHHSLYCWLGAVNGSLWAWFPVALILFGCVSGLQLEPYLTLFPAHLSHPIPNVLSTRSCHNSQDRTQWIGIRNYLRAGIYLAAVGRLHRSCVSCLQERIILRVNLWVEEVITLLMSFIIIPVDYYP